MTATLTDGPRLGQLSLLPDPIDQAFLRFHHANPQVYRRLVGMARQWRDAGHARCSISMLFEVLRYDEGLRTSSPDGFRLNNNFRSRYSRIIQANEPDLAGFFETRALAPERGVGPAGRPAPVDRRQHHTDVEET